MAEQTTFGAKMEVEQKEALQQKIANSGMTAAEFLQTAINAYEASFSKATVINDRDIQLLDNHLARISEIFINMAKGRHDEGENFTIKENDLLNQIKNLKIDLLDLRQNTNEEIEVMRLSVEEAQKEALDAVSQMQMAEDNENQIKRAYDRLEAFNQQLQAQQEELKIQSENAKETAKIAQREVVEIQDRLTLADKEKTALQGKFEAKQTEFERVSGDLAESKRINQGLSDKLDTEREQKNQALGELKAVNAHNQTLQEQLHQQTPQIADLKQRIWELEKELSAKPAPKYEE